MSEATELVITGPRPLRGGLRLPGDKGISHRALFAGALASGPTHLTGLAPGDDVVRTRAALASLGVEFTDGDDDGALTIEGAGADALRAPADDIDCGNSGTTLRMLAGLVAARPFRTVLTGDASLVERPMGRVAEPLRALGAVVDGRDGGNLPPLVVQGGPLHGTNLTLEVASGQVKTALVLAGLQADGLTEIVEPAPSRDHTERLFGALGAPVERVDDRTFRVRAGAPAPFDLRVPGDPSSAAFFVVAALVTPGSELYLEDVLLNPGRLAFVDALRAMGATIEVHVLGERLGEPVGDLEVATTPLHGTTVVCTEAMIDEVPALAVAAAFAEGVTEFIDVAELRVKESDRLATLDEELAALGAGVERGTDRLAVRGGKPEAAMFKSHGDHRVAMAAAVAANAIEGESHIGGWSSVAVSYPGFADDLETLTGGS